MRSTWTTSRFIAWTLAASLAFPVMALTAGCGNQNNTANSPTGGGGGYTTASNPVPAPAKPGLTTKQKVILLGGAALLYYIYRKDLANNAKAQGAATANGKPQLYREVKGPNAGAIYYRDPQTHKPVWVTAPSQPVQVPAAQLQQYAPGYEQYMGQPAPPVPAGQATVPATQYDPTLGTAGANGPTM